MTVLKPSFRFIVGVCVVLAACGGDSPTSPTSPYSPDKPPPGFSPGRVQIRLDEGGAANRSNPFSEFTTGPWADFSVCGRIINAGPGGVTLTVTMQIFGPNGDMYATTGTRQVTMGDGDSLLGCGLATARDYDPSHAFPVKYRLHVHYVFDDRAQGTVEPEAAMSAPPVNPGVVISEFRTRGPRGDQDQFIELHNPTAQPVAMSGWVISVSNTDGKLSGQPRLLPMPAVTLQPGCHYLVGWGPSSGIGTYSGRVAADADMALGLIDGGGVALRTATGYPVDQVGLGPSALFHEGSPLAPFGADNTDRSYSRLGADTGDNSADFRVVSPSNPENSSMCRR